MGKSPNELAQDLQTLGELMHAAGRDLDELHISIRCVVEFVDEPWDRPFAERRTLKGTAAEIQGTLNAFAAAGVHEVVIDPSSAELQVNRDIMQRVMALMA